MGNYVNGQTMRVSTFLVMHKEDAHVYSTLYDHQLELIWGGKVHGKMDDRNGKELGVSSSYSATERMSISDVNGNGWGATGVRYEGGRKDKMRIMHIDTFISAISIPTDRANICFFWYIFSTLLYYTVAGLITSSYCQFCCCFCFCCCVLVFSSV